MLFAGLYESWYPERNKLEVTFTIVTCAANAVIGEIHDRMLVILDERVAEDWMNPREEDPLSLNRLLVPAPSELLVISLPRRSQTAWSVSFEMRCWSIALRNRRSKQLRGYTTTRERSDRYSLTGSRSQKTHICQLSIFGRSAQPARPTSRLRGRCCPPDGAC